MKRGEAWPKVRTRWTLPRRGNWQQGSPVVAVADFSGLVGVPTPDNPFATNIFHEHNVYSDRYVYVKEYCAVYWEWAWTSTDTHGRMRLFQRPLFNTVADKTFEVRFFSAWVNEWTTIQQNDSFVFDIWNGAILEPTGCEDILFPAPWLPRFNGVSRRAALYSEMWAEGYDNNNTAPSAYVDLPPP